MPAMKLVQAVTRRPKRGVRSTIADNHRDLSAAASCHVRRSNKLERISQCVLALNFTWQSKKKLCDNLFV